MNANRIQQETADFVRSQETASHLLDLMIGGIEDAPADIKVNPGVGDLPKRLGAALALTDSSAPQAAETTYTGAFPCAF
jgi:hypothetical protein